MDWLDLIVYVVNKAAEMAALPLRTVAFDGESWVWVWRDMEAQGGVPETAMRVQPDVMEEGVEATVAAGAWMREHRHIASGRTLYTRYVSFADLDSQRDRLAEVFARHLRNAQDAARSMVERLPALMEERETFSKTLRERNTHIR